MVQIPCRKRERDDGSRVATQCEASHQAAVYSTILSRDQAPRERYIRAHAEPPRAEHESELVNMANAILASDAENQQLLDEIVLRCGWPKGPLHGGNLEAAFLTVHHSPLEFALKYQVRMQESHESGDIPERAFSLFMARLAKHIQAAELGKSALPSFSTPNR